MWLLENLKLHVWLDLRQVLDSLGLGRGRGEWQSESGTCGPLEQYLVVIRAWDKRGRGLIHFQGHRGHWHNSVPQILTEVEEWSSEEAALGQRQSKDWLGSWGCRQCRAGEVQGRTQAAASGSGGAHCWQKIERQGVSRGLNQGGSSLGVGNPLLRGAVGPNTVQFHRYLWELILLDTLNQKLKKHSAWLQSAQSLVGQMVEDRWTSNCGTSDNLLCPLQREWIHSVDKEQCARESNISLD